MMAAENKSLTIIIRLTIGRFSVILLAFALLYGERHLKAQSDTSRSMIIQSLLPRDSAERAAIEADLDIVSLGLEVFPAPGSGTFFEEYQKLFGTQSSLRAYASPRVIGRVRLNDHLRFILSSSYIRTGFTEIYDAFALQSGVADSIPLVPAAQIFEEMSITTLPLLIGVQFSPIRSQFTSYVGALAGVALVTAEWQTLTRNFDVTQYFRPETNTDGPGLVPGIRLFTGVDLRFDRFFVSRNVFRGIFIEASYFYLPLSRVFFKEVRTIGRLLPQVPSADDAILNLGGFTISLGVNMQLFRF